MSGQTSDFLVIGCGIAGLSCALRVAEHGTVVVLAKGDAGVCNTAWAQGGIAAVWSQDDSLDSHVDDTVEAGAWLADPDRVKEILKDGHGAVDQLIQWGVRFDLRADADEHPDYDLTREGGHSNRRILHSGDITGTEIQRKLMLAAHRHPQITVLDGHVAIDLITERRVARHLAKSRLGVMGPEVEHRYGPGGPEGWMPGQKDRCVGAYVLDERTGKVGVFEALVTLLATGGAGKVYRYTSNPDLATGDGMAMAYRAGAVMANMEFVQFHPTCLYSPQEKNFLVSEALRGEGGILRLPDGTPFMDGVHPRGSLAPRDIVAREIDASIKRDGLEYVLLDMTDEDADFVTERFPGIHARLMAVGLDMTKVPIPVVPAAHYFCGGIKVDLQGRTLIGGLLAAGEVTNTGLHGANRLASNSLLEGAVFGMRTADAAVEEHARAASMAPVEIPPWDSGGARDSDEIVVIAHTWDEIRRLMWNYVGIVRTDRRLTRALARIELIQEEIRGYYWDFIVTRDLVELRNLVTVAELVIRSALGRRESRGLHYNLDCPDTDDVNWRRDTLLRREW
ncbi:MAG: L-aspartate oxidase [Proteobacteria bacterium]|nr:L-aspartate oxidase [Pseudomonadota bacterium]